MHDTGPDRVDPVDDALTLPGCRLIIRRRQRPRGSGIGVGIRSSGAGESWRIT